MRERTKRSLVLILCFGLLLTGCGSRNIRILQNESPKRESGDRAEEKTERQEEYPEPVTVSTKEVVMIYMVGSDLESKGGMASIDIEEMEESGFDEENLTVFLCTGGTSRWWMDEIPTDSCMIYQVTEGEIVEIDSLGERNMAEPSTLSDFIDYVYEDYPAENYGLVLWDHGGGAILGYGADENYDYDALEMKELDSALADTQMAEDGKKFTWIGFDACLMGMIEVADVLAEYSDYMIASEEIEAGTGWSYAFLDTLSDGQHYAGADAGQCILDAYENYYYENYKYIPDYTLACMDLSKTDNVIEKLDALVAVADDELRQGGYSSIAQGRDQTKSFGLVGDMDFYDTIDLYDLCDKLSILYPQETKKLQGAISDCVVAQRTNVSSAHGLAIYFPYGNKVLVDEWLDVYGETGFSANYISFIRDFAATLSGEPISDWDVSITVPTEDEEEAGEYYVQLTEEQLANYGHATYQLWEEDEGHKGTYIQWLESADVTLTKDGKLSTNFDGKVFYLEDTSGNSMRCCASEIEHTDDYSKYEIPIMISQKGVGKMHGVYVHIKVDAEHPDGEVIGIYNKIDTDSALFPDKNLVEVEDGDHVYAFLFARKIIFNEDGSVAPFEEWEMNSGLGEDFKVSGDLTVSIREPEEASEYCCLFEIADTQGNYYYTNPIYIEQ